MSTLSPVQVRVLGALIEKALTTPQYYPLTLNALVNACNQKSARDPVVSFEESEVVEALDGLRRKGLTGESSGAGSRVVKYRHNAGPALNLDDAEVAALCELMLRGPQTAGEIRTRAARMHEYESVGEVQAILDRLSLREEPLVVMLPRRPGQKESRYAHLLSGGPDEQAMETVGIRSDDAAPNSLAAIRQELSELREEFEALKAEFTAWRKEFE